MRYEHTYQKIKVRSNLETNWLSAACISADRSFEGSARKTVEISARIRRADAGRLWLCGRERAISFGCELDERGGCEVSGVEFCEVTYCPRSVGMYPFNVIFFREFPGAQSQRRGEARGLKPRERCAHLLYEPFGSVGAHVVRARCGVFSQWRHCCLRLGRWNGAHVGRQVGQGAHGRGRAH